MGAFGAIYAALTGILCAKDYVKQQNIDFERKQLAKSNNDDVYFDSHGNMRLTKNDHIVVHDQLKNGDMTLYDMKEYRTVKNYTKEKRDIEKQKWIDAGMSVYPVGDGCHNGETVEGERYVDVKTKDIYVVRNFYKYGGGKYFMDIETGYLIRPVDLFYKKMFYINKLNKKVNKIEKFYYNNGELTYSFMEEFNKKRNKDKYSDIMLSCYYMSDCTSDISICTDEHVKKLVMKMEDNIDE